MNQKYFLIGIAIGAIIALIITIPIFFLSTSIGEPVVYFYPTHSLNVSVQLQTDELIETAAPQTSLTSPAHWTFTANPDGKITTDGQNYPYLLYETTYFGRPFNLQKGWSVNQQQLPAFLNQTLKKMGLNDAETTEFIHYWTRHLPTSPYYSIYPVPRNQIDQKLDMTIMPEPDQFIRIIIGFKPTNSAEKLEEPTITTPTRTGFTAVEWGGFIAR